MTPADRARRAVADLLAAYLAARTSAEREEVAAIIAAGLTPHGRRSLTELAEEALR